MLKQLSVFVENKAGSVYEVAETLHKAGVDISALCIADTARFGILRMIVDDPKKAMEILKENGHTVSLTDVFAVCINDQPGGMIPLLKLFNEAGIGVEYMYAFVGKATLTAYVIVRVEETAKAQEILDRAGFGHLSQEELKNAL